MVFLDLGGVALGFPGGFYDFFLRGVLSGVYLLNDLSRASARQTGPALESHYQFILWLMPTLDRFPRSQKFLLGDRIQNTALNVLESLIEATYTRQRNQHLSQANLGLEKLRFLLRLAWELHYLNRRRYEHAARTIDEVGRRVGAWRKAHHAHEST